MSRSIDILLHGATRRDKHVRVMNEDRPDVHYNKEDEVKLPLHWKEKDKKVVWDRL